MRIGRRWNRVLIALLAGIGGLVAAHRTDAAAQHSFAGHWEWTMDARCVDSADNRDACDELLAMGVHVYALRVTRLEYYGVDHLTVDAAGRFTESGSAQFSARSPGGVPLRSCDPSLMEREYFQASCGVTWSGTGHIARGGTFLFDFYTDTGRLIYHSRAASYGQRYDGVGDSLLPAVPGTYHTHRYLKLVGSPELMPGITISLTVTRK